MPKILCEKLAGLYVMFACGGVQFDEQGVGDIPDEEVYMQTLMLKEFSPVLEDVEPEEPLKTGVEVEEEVIEVAETDIEEITGIGDKEEMEDIGKTEEVIEVEKVEITPIRKAVKTE